MDNAWIRAPAPGRDVAAAYFDVVNRSASPVDLVGARTDAANNVEIHTHIHEGELMQMRKVDAITLPPGEPIAFAPSGNHLMLFDFQAPTSNRIPITLLFSDATEQTIMFELRTVSGATQP
ncbi:MAG TPA: copper chaperone PCu(A)C [Pseudomonadales bacterium]